MNGLRESNSGLVAAVRDWSSSTAGVETAVFPPYVYLADIAALLNGSNVRYGAQNVSAESPGAYTGEVAASMLADLGCHYVIVGHSERRSLYAEDDATVARKFQAAQAANLTPILCVGELLEERESGATESVVARQLDAVLSTSGASAFARAVIAYEPVWAIGTGKTATPEQAQEVHASIRKRLASHDATIADRTRILYGGSVKAANAAEIFRMEDVDGGLIGGASLKADEFVAICAAAVQSSN